MGPSRVPSTSKGSSELVSVYYALISYPYPDPYLYPDPWDYPYPYSPTAL